MVDCKPGEEADVRNIAHSLRLYPKATVRKTTFPMPERFRG
jgi:hypothetical protein